MVHLMHATESSHYYRVLNDKEVITFTQGAQSKTLPGIIPPVHVKILMDFC